VNGVIEAIPSPESSLAGNMTDGGGAKIISMTKLRIDLLDLLFKGDDQSHNNKDKY
jgi:hypothetical protein